LAVDAGCSPTSVLAPAFPGVLQQSPVGDQTLQLAEPFGRISRREGSSMFKFAEWGAHAV
jgi:hypothetical protein